MMPTLRRISVKEMESVGLLSKGEIESGKENGVDHPTCRKKFRGTENNCGLGVVALVDLLGRVFFFGNVSHLLILHDED